MAGIKRPSPIKANGMKDAAGRDHLLPSMQLAASFCLDGAGAPLDLCRGSWRSRIDPHHRRRLPDRSGRRNRLGKTARRRLPGRAGTEAARARQDRPGPRPRPCGPRFRRDMTFASLETKGIMKPSKDIRELLAIMAQLRTPVTGCPWDL